MLKQANEHADMRLDATQLATYSITRKDGLHVGNVTQLAPDRWDAEVELDQEHVDGCFEGRLRLEGHIEAPDWKSLLEKVKAFLDSRSNEWRGGFDQVMQLADSRSVEWWMGFYEGLHHPLFKQVRERKHSDGNHHVFQSLRMGKPTPKQEEEGEEASGPATMTVTYTPPGGTPETSTLKWTPETRRFLEGGEDA